MNERETIAAIAAAAKRLGGDRDRLRRIDIFLNYWPVIDAYTPPAGVVEDVHQIVAAFRHLASVRSTTEGEKP